MYIGIGLAVGVVLFIIYMVISRRRHEIKHGYQKKIKNNFFV